MTTFTERRYLSMSSKNSCRESILVRQVLALHAEIWAIDFLHVCGHDFFAIPIMLGVEKDLLVRVRLTGTYSIRRKNVEDVRTGSGLHLTCNSIA